MKDLSMVGGHIRRFRQCAGLTQEQLATQLFVSAQSVSKWECGTALPDIGNLYAMSKILGVTADALLGLSVGAGPVYLGIDGGGTKTEFVLCGAEGHIVNRTVLEGCNPNGIGIARACTVLQTGIDAMIAANPEIAGIYAGIAGCASGDNGKNLTEFLRRRYPHIPSVCTTDIYNVFACSGTPEASIAVICGTGSIVYARQKGGLVRFGGWGYLFGDRCSGFAIGRDVLCAALAAADGISAETCLRTLAEEKLGGAVWNSIEDLYSRERSFIADFAPLAFTAQAAGDVEAIRILREHTAALARQIDRAVDVIGTSARIVMAGGMITHNPLLREMIADAMTHRLSVTVPDVPPVYGAFVRCLSQFGGGTVTAGTLDTFRREYAKLTNTMGDIQK